MFQKQIFDKDAISAIQDKVRAVNQYNKNTYQKTLADKQRQFSLQCKKLEMQLAEAKDARQIQQVKN